MNQFEMVEYIKDRLEAATPEEIEAIYWMVEMELS